MSLVLESLGDPVWQIGGGILVLAVMVLTLALRSPEAGVSAERQREGTRLVLGVGLSFFLLLSAGVALVHGVTPPPTGSHEAPLPVLTHALLPVPSPTPSPLPVLTPSTAQVLTTFCDAINRHDENTAWSEFAKSLQQDRTKPAAPSGRIKIVHCLVGNVSETSSTGMLLLRQVAPNGYADGYDRPYQFTLSVEGGAWKITHIAYCISDGCLDDTHFIVP